MTGRLYSSPALEGRNYDLALPGLYMSITIGDDYLAPYRGYPEHTHDQQTIDRGYREIPDTVVEAAKAALQASTIVTDPALVAEMRTLIWS